MFAKLVKGKDPTDLERALNECLTDHKFDPAETEPIKKNNSGYPDQVAIDAVEREAKKRLKIYQVQQFIMQEVDAKSVSIINQQPVIKVSICLLLICGYE